MSELSVVVEPDGEETATLCECCGRAMFDGCGILRSGEDDLADYWYRWSDGHEQRCYLAVSACDSNCCPVGGLAVLSAHGDGQGISYSVLGPGDSPWPSHPTFGPVLTREQVLSGDIVPNVFALVDAIAANEPRLASRILSADWA
jgi:hypothetical protein